MTKKAMIYVYFLIGWVFTGLAFLGVFLPVLPTVPFLLVAVWAFGKSSPRFRQWIFEHPWFRDILQDWFDHGCIARRSKVIAVSVMALSGGFSIVYIPNIYGALGVLCILIAAAVFIVTRPEKPAPLS